MIDLNADLGEGGANDYALLKLVSSANIACGYHAGDDATMRQSVIWAKELGVAIGAHPSFADRENFGRSRQNLHPDEVYQLVTEQLHALNRHCLALGATLRHVKPHGMLYNQAAVDPALAHAIARAVLDFNPALRLVGLAGSALISEGQALGLTTWQEVFADRNYQADGSLISRSEPDALITDDQQALRHTLMMVQHHQVVTPQGDIVPVQADTVCLHGDNAHALDFARLLRAHFSQQGIKVSAE
ncbi:5-oxoprolinase subunit PxpA [Hafnia alvei]|uniref:5-oxoprolinase subunit PxpA n=1 Tax=Hafnia alvei TaxID=569 RepID=A0ABD7Q108_HAFAL|nr:5-oxoprolinase subunit PxpA [Hafnia alvei]MDN6072140.1 5-oxoprolinase subunit PxpA [Enterobacterales bacterium]TBL65909.1 5-oxoprolinase subunit PxpA [Hafnia alvei]